MNNSQNYKITVFHCINTFNDTLPAILDNGEVECIKMACSSMVKDVYLLRAFENGADAVVVMVCPDGQCRHVEGNTRAYKRVSFVQNLLDEIGINGKRLSIVSVAQGDITAAEKHVQETLSGLDALGPNPAVPLTSTAVA